MRRTYIFLAALLTVFAAFCILGPEDSCATVIPPESTVIDHDLTLTEDMTLDKYTVFADGVTVDIGTYTLSTSSQDGSKVFITGDVTFVISDNGTVHGKIVHNPAATIVVESFELPAPSSVTQYSFIGALDFELSALPHSATLNFIPSGEDKCLHAHVVDDGTDINLCVTDDDPFVTISSSIVPDSQSSGFIPLPVTGQIQYQSTFEYFEVVKTDHDAQSNAIITSYRAIDTDPSAGYTIDVTADVHGLTFNRLAVDAFRQSVYREETGIETIFYAQGMAFGSVTMDADFQLSVDMTADLIKLSKEVGGTPSTDTSLTDCTVTTVFDLEEATHLIFSGETDISEYLAVISSLGLTSENLTITENGSIEVADLKTISAVWLNSGTANSATAHAEKVSDGTKYDLEADTFAFVNLSLDYDLILDADMNIGNMHLTVASADTVDIIASDTALVVERLDIYQLADINYRHGEIGIQDLIDCSSHLTFSLDSVDYYRNSSAQPNATLEGLSAELFRDNDGKNKFVLGVDSVTGTIRADATTDLELNIKPTDIVLLSDGSLSEIIDLFIKGNTFTSDVYASITLDTSGIDVKDRTVGKDDYIAYSLQKTSDSVPAKAHIAVSIRHFQDTDILTILFDCNLHGYNSVANAHLMYQQPSGVGNYTLSAADTDVSLELKFKKNRSDRTPLSVTTDTRATLHFDIDHYGIIIRADMKGARIYTDDALFTPNGFSYKECGLINIFDCAMYNGVSLSLTGRLSCDEFVFMENPWKQIGEKYLDLKVDLEGFGLEIVPEKVLGAKIGKLHITGKGTDGSTIDSTVSNISFSKQLGGSNGKDDDSPVYLRVLVLIIPPIAGGTAAYFIMRRRHGDVVPESGTLFDSDIDIAEAVKSGPLGKMKKKDP